MLYYNHANNKKCVQKVGELLNKHEIAIDVFNKVGSIAKTADFVAVGLKNYDVVSLCNQGYIERIRNGFYKLPNAEEPKEEALISKLLPQGIVCVESALGTVTLLLVNGQLLSPVPFQERSKQCRKSLSKLIMFRTSFTITVLL